jgi:6-pyruvoyl-tetrahydropterin synthase
MNLTNNFLSGTSLEVLLSSQNHVYNCKVQFFMEENLFYKEMNSLLKKILDLEGSFFENDSVMAQYLLKFTEKLFEGLNCLNCKLRFEFNKEFGLEFQNTAPKVVVFKSWRLKALHKHYNNSLSPSENELLYRKCSHLHGHDYRFTMEAESLNFSKELLGVRSVFHDVEEKILWQLKDHILNDIIGNTSGETLLLFIFKKLQNHLPRPAQYRFVLQETYRNSFSLSYKS